MEECRHQTRHVPRPIVLAHSFSGGLADLGRAKAPATGKEPGLASRALQNVDSMRTSVLIGHCEIRCTATNRLWYSTVWSAESGRAFGLRRGSTTDRRRKVQGREWVPTAPSARVWLPAPREGGGA